MANKPIPVGIVRTRPRFEGESPHWLVWVWGISDFFNWVWGCTYPRHITRPRL